VPLYLPRRFERLCVLPCMTAVRGARSDRHAYIGVYLLDGGAFCVGAAPLVKNAPTPARCRYVADVAAFIPVAIRCVI